MTQNATSQPKSAAQIRAEIDAARTELASTLDSIRAETTPAALGARGVKAVKGAFVNQDGSPRLDRIGIAVGTVAALIVLKRLTRRRCNCR